MDARWQEHLDDVEDWMKGYAESGPERERANNALLSALKARLDDDGLNYHAIECRIKEHSSLKSKLLKRKEDGTPKYPDGLQEIDDVIGARVITYLDADVRSAIQSLEGSFTPIERVDKTQEQKAKGEFGYSGQHLVLEVPNDDPPGGCGNIKGQRFEVQIRTILQHAWAEFEHDIRYKGVGGASAEINRAFTLASGLIELADEKFSEIHEIVQGQQTAAITPESPPTASTALLSGEGLQELLEQTLPSHPRSRADHYDWLSDILAALGVTDVSNAADIFAGADWAFIKSKIGYKMIPGHVRAADDALLHHFGEAYIDRTSEMGEDLGRPGKLKYRLKKLREHT